MRVEEGGGGAQQRTYPPAAHVDGVGKLRARHPAVALEEVAPALGLPHRRRIDIHALRRRQAGTRQVQRPRRGGSARPRPRGGEDVGAAQRGERHHSRGHGRRHARGGGGGCKGRLTPRQGPIHGGHVGGLEDGHRPGGAADGGEQAGGGKPGGPRSRFIPQQGDDIQGVGRCGGLWGERNRIRGAL